MAEDTASLRLVAWFGFFSGMAGISLLIWTLQETRKSTDAAEAQLRSAEKTSKKELRAYLTVEPDGIKQLIASKNAIGMVVLRNVGRLPARKVQLIVRMERSVEPEHSAHNRRTHFSIPRPGIWSDRVVQPGATMRQGSEKPYLAIASICEPHHSVYVYGIAVYDNGYGLECETRFCHRYSTNGRTRKIKDEMVDWKTVSMVTCH